MSTLCQTTYLNEAAESRGLSNTDSFVSLLKKYKRLVERLCAYVQGSTSKKTERFNQQQELLSASIGFGCHMIWRIMQIKNMSRSWRLLSIEAHNTPFDLHNSSYHNEPSPMIVLYSFKYFQLHQNILTLIFVKFPSSKRLPVFLGSFRLWSDFSSRTFSSNSSCHPLSGIFAKF